MKSKELLRLLTKDGWVIDRISGSHCILKKGVETIVVPVHNKEMPTGLCESLLKKAGLK